MDLITLENSSYLISVSLISVDFGFYTLELILHFHYLEFMETAFTRKQRFYTKFSELVSSFSLLA